MNEDIDDEEHLRHLVWAKKAGPKIHFSSRNRSSSFDIKREMGDVAEILGLGGNRKADGLSVEASKILGIGDKKNVILPKTARKPKGMSREVFGLLGQDGISSSMQSQPVTQSSQIFKSKRTTSTHGKWSWSPVRIYLYVNSMVVHIN